MHLRRTFAIIAHACGGASALTWAAWLITLPLSVGVALAPESVDSTRSLEAGALAAVAAHIALIPVFVIALWWLRHRRPLVAVLVIYALLGALRGLIVVVLEQSIAPSDGTSLIGRIVVSAVLAVFGFVTIAVVLDRIRTYQSSRQRLREALRRVQMSGSLPSQLATVESTLHELAQHTSISSEELASGIHELIRRDVRPLSHRLIGEPDDFGEFATPSPRTHRIRLRMPPPNPWLVALALEGGAFIAVARHVGPGTALINAVLASLAILAIGFPLNAMIQRLAGDSRAAALSLITVGYAGVGGIAMLFSDLIFLLFGSIEPLYLMAIPFAALWAVLVSVATGADSQAQATEEALAELLRAEVIDATVSRVNAQTLARTMHGSVQGELTAIMMGLRKDSSPLSVPDAQARLLTISASLVDSLVAGEAPSPTRTGDEIDSFFDVWSQALDLQWSMDGNCRTRLRNDPVAWSAVRTVVMEGLTNVVRHASQPRAVVGVDEEDDRIQVDVTSPGTLDITSPGVGLHTLRESYESVELLQGSGQVTLHVLVARDELRWDPSRNLRMPEGITSPD